MSLDSIRSDFCHRTLAPDSLFLLSSQDAIEFIDRCVAAGFSLAGVEGFIVTESGAFQPDRAQSNDVADGSWGQPEFVERTKSLINDGAQYGYVYDVVIESRPNAP